MVAMGVIVVLGMKGGAGKSTLSVHLAVAAAEKSRVVLLDCDPQQTVIAWAKMRTAEQPRILASRPEDIRSVLAKASADVAIVDTAPRVAPEAALLAAGADLIVAPIRPSMPDLAASQTTFRVADASHKPFVIVLNAVTYRSMEAEDTRKLLAKYTVAPVSLGQRIAYARALATGRSVTEFDPKSEAASEINALWDYVKGRIK
jgi:chromosome partitioning protein